MTTPGFDAAMAVLLESLPDCVLLPLAPGFVELERGALRVVLSTVEFYRTGGVALRLAETRGIRSARIVLVGDLTLEELHTARTVVGSVVVLRENVRPAELLTAVEQSFELLLSQKNSENHNQRLSRTEYELDELIDVARALTKERDTSRLLGLILERSRFVTAADAGSLYVVEGTVQDNRVEPEQRILHFRLSQNDSIQFDSEAFQIPVSRASMAGFVVLERVPIRIDDVYALPEYCPFSFDPSFDKLTGYRSKSMLSVPLISSRGQVIGVLQVINKKRRARGLLKSEADVAELVVPFDDHSERLLVTLAAQAGIALENALLYDEIRGLFEGFVRASVDAIEARDPTTSGHSRRVAELTLRLADAVDRADTGPYRDVHFSLEARRELEYASLLHDFGKIGVRENVLVKEKKLYPYELEAIRLRIELGLRDLDVECMKQQSKWRERQGSDEEVARFGEFMAARRSELSRAYETICVAAEPSVLKSRDRELLAQIEGLTLRRADGGHERLLSDDELGCLHIERGSLTAAELAEIRSHVTHTHRFLSRIPWGASLRNLPLIAGAHHERLDGTGYPFGLLEAEIPVQSKLMSIADIFDALVASDRPYKRALPIPRALEILELEVREHHLDAELVRIFRQAEVWRD